MIIMSRNLEQVDVSKIILEIDNNIEVEVLKKPNRREYEIGVNILEMGFGRYNDGQVFHRRNEAFDERDKILAELRKGGRGKYKIAYKGKGKISLYLAD